MFQLPVLYGRTLDDRAQGHRRAAPAPMVNADIDAEAARAGARPLARSRLSRTGTAPASRSNSLADLKGMKIRNSGGAGQAWRARFLGAIPNTTAWPNVPLALSQGTFDALVSHRREPRQRQALGSRREILARGPPVRRRIHPDGEPGLLEQAVARPAEDDDAISGRRTSRPTAPTWRRRRPRRAQTLESHGVKIADPTAQRDRRTSARR